MTWVGREGGRGTGGRGREHDTAPWSRVIELGFRIIAHYTGRIDLLSFPLDDLLVAVCFRNHFNRSPLSCLCYLLKVPHLFWLLQNPNVSIAIFGCIIISVPSFPPSLGVFSLYNRKIGYLTSLAGTFMKYICRIDQSFADIYTYIQLCVRLNLGVIVQRLTDKSPTEQLSERDNW